ncbi:MAG: hypothetical protein AB1342_07380 [Pseudomonadota bacterium]
MKLAYVIVSVAALSGAALSAGTASAMPIAPTEAVSNIDQVRYCGRSYGYGYGGGGYYSPRRYSYGYGYGGGWRGRRWY